MAKKIIGVLILIVLFIFTQPVFAGSIAGSSAQLETISSDELDLNSSVDRSIKRAVITEVLEKYDSPLLTEVDAFMDACTASEIDCYLLPSITGLESSFGRFLLPGSYNPFGWGGGYIIFDSWSDGFNTVAQGLKKNYIGSGATTIEEIGPIYAASPTWAQRVRLFHNEFERVETEKKTYYTKLAFEL